jgi:hypothetical protein
MNATNNVTKKLSILVIEDTLKHQQAARLQLAEHDVTIAGGYAEGNKLIWENEGKWDVVLLDLMLPASMCGAGGSGEKMEGQEMPIGTILAFLALKNGCKNVAIVTDLNHHKHPASAAFDWFGGKKRFQVGDANIFFTNYGEAYADQETFELIDNLSEEEREVKYPYVPGVGCKNTVFVKPWKRVLDKTLFGGNENLPPPKAG